MKIDHQRRSKNVEDRRGQGGSGFGGGGRGGGRGSGMLLNLIVSMLFSKAGRRFILPLIIIGVIGFVVFPDQMRGIFGALQGGQVSAPASSSKPNAASDQSFDFSAAVLGSTEDVWQQLFAAQGQQYRPTAMVVYSGGTRSGCGSASASMGPFYCPADQKVYLDVSFFDEMARRMDAPGDFAQAYVIAHEVGHHVQDEMGVLNRAHQRQQALGRGSAQANAVQVQVELQADCYAGLWAGRAQKLSNVVLDTGDLREAIGAAHAVGDDTLQRKARGTIVPESFTHGSAAQRIAAFELGLKRGSIAACQTDL